MKLLTFTLEGSAPDFARSEVLTCFRAACDQWQRSGVVEFEAWMDTSTETTTCAPPDITLCFEHPHDKTAFMQSWAVVNGHRIQIDPYLDWNLGTSYFDRNDIFPAYRYFLHEIGHVLGMEHDEEHSDSIMYAADGIHADPRKVWLPWGGLPKRDLDAVEHVLDEPSDTVQLSRS